MARLYQRRFLAQTIRRRRDRIDQVSLPHINVQPVSTQQSIGQLVHFGVNASGHGLSYQWKKNGVAVGGATTSACSFTSAYVAEGTYTCEITNDVGTVVTFPVTFTIPTIPLQGESDSAELVGGEGGDLVGQE